MASAYETKNPNVQIGKPNKAAVLGAVVLTAAAVGLGVKMKEGSNTFETDLNVPTESQPHIEYTVMPGDSESTIAEKFGHGDSMDYMNMINQQLPEADQSTRTLRPGEHLTLPKE